MNRGELAVMDLLFITAMTSIWISIVL